MKRVIYPLFAPADESKVLPVLDALRQAGVTVRSDKPGKEDALLLFLSESVKADGPEADSFFRLNPGRELVIPVNLDGSAPPEALRNALMARHTLDGRKYGLGELADLIARAARGESRNRLPLILSIAAAVILFLAGGIILWRNRSEKPGQTSEVATPSPTPTAVPVFPEEVDLTLEQLEQVHQLIIVGNSFTPFYGNEEWIADKGRARVNVDYVANRNFENGQAHWHSAADGHEFTLYDWGDLSFLSYMKNLKLLTLVRVQGTLPDLSGLEKLDNVELFDCAIPDLSGLRGTRLVNFGYDGPVMDFSPLNDCRRLDRVDMSLYGSAPMDMASFSPVGLKELDMDGDTNQGTMDLSGLNGCEKLETIRLRCLPLVDLDCLSGATKLQYLELDDLEQLTSLKGLDGHDKLTYLRIDNCFLLSDLSAMSSCAYLKTLYIQDCPISDLSFLAGAPYLYELQAESMSSLRSLHGLEDHGNLQNVHLFGLGRLTDISALSSCQKLKNLWLHECYNLEDIRPVVKLPNLRSLQIYGSLLRDVDFLWDIQNKEYFQFGIAEVENWEGLAAIQTYSYLNITDRNGSALPYIEHATVTDFELYNRGGRGNLSEGMDLSRLPRVTNNLMLRCVPSLEGLNQPDIRWLTVDDCPRLTSLVGVEGLNNLVGMEVCNCPRLTDWSALNGKALDQLDLEALFTLPDFGTFEAKRVNLTTIYDLKDLSCFAGYDQDGYAIALMDADGVTDLSPLYHLHGSMLKIPAHLRDQAQIMVDSGLLDSYEVIYPEGWWEPIEPHIELQSLEEIDSLPSALLGRVRSLTLAGDFIVPDEEAWVEEDYSTYPPALYIRYSGEEERIPVEPGTLTDLSCLEKLTGLEGLSVYAQPRLVSLEGIQNLSELQRLNVHTAPALADASTAFTVQSLEELSLRFTGVTSLQGIQNLYALKWLDVNDSPVEDLSPLTACQALENVNFFLPMMTFEELKAQPEVVRRYIRSLTVAGKYVYDGGPWWFEEDWVTDPPQLYLHSNETDERLPLLEGAFMDVGELAELLPGLERLNLYGQDMTTLDGVEDFPQLWSITIEECRKIADFTALWRSPSLGDISLRNEPIDSIEGIEQMPRLVSLSLSGTDVTDFSPLERVDYSYCTSEEYDGWGFWLALDVWDADDLTFEDYAVLEAVPVYWGLNMNNVPVDRWLGHVMAKEMHELSCHRSDMSNEELKAFVTAHPMLKQLDLRWNPQLTDLSPLPELKELREVLVSRDMAAAVASLGEGYAFRLEIE